MSSPLRQFLLASGILATPFVQLGTSQSLDELQTLLMPRELALSSHGAQLYFKLGAEQWEIETTANAKAVRAALRPPTKAVEPPKVQGTSRINGVLRSPDGAKVAFLDSAKPEMAWNLFCQCEGDSHDARRISDLPIRAFQWTADSKSFWVLISNGADIAVGSLSLDGRFTQLSSSAAMRGIGGLVAANDVVAWVQSDASHHGTIWIKDKAGKIYQLWDPNPQTTKWSESWTQEVVRWKNAHGEELQGVLARPSGRSRVPLIVDPYSGWQNRFLNIGLLGNYTFVKAGFAVFYPNHRGPFAFPAVSFGDAYVGSSRDRDPIEVLTDDVMTGVQELVRRGDADRDRMFLYSFSTGASAIDQLLTQTTAFRAAISFAGVADWLGYYRANQARGDETIPNFLGGRKPEDSPELYDRISPVQHADRIRTPLLLVIGDKDSIPGGGSRYRDTLAFHDALRKAGSPVELIVHPGHGHGIDARVDKNLLAEHVEKAIDYFRSHMPAERK
jgi:dipeptidyl aminopeptidase/acylaminoacyl peptidase